MWLGLIRDLGANTITWEDGTPFNRAIYPAPYTRNRGTHFYLHYALYAHDISPFNKRKVLCQANRDQVPVY